MLSSLTASFTAQHYLVRCLVSRLSSWQPHATLVVVSRVPESPAPVFDIENIPVVKYVAVAGRNVTISCPGVNEHSLIDTLIWKTTQTVAEYVNGSPLVNNPRITLLPGNFSLHISPTSSADTAEYTCLFNDRHSPEAIADLLVQDVPDPPGRPLVVSFTSRSVDLSWAHSQDARNAPVTNFIIETR
uniref:Ig-like domain-containing protein n=1 Tax=Anopheles melas TaxID=34690 RepID=A0A182THB1_9DIPT